MNVFFSCVAMTALLASGSAFAKKQNTTKSVRKIAGTGSSSVSCNLEDQVVALYSSFNSSADSYSSVRLFLFKAADDRYTEYAGDGSNALATVYVKAGIGTFAVKPDLKNNTCSIEEL